MKIALMADSSSGITQKVLLLCGIFTRQTKAIPALSSGVIRVRRFITEIRATFILIRLRPTPTI